MWEAIKEFFSVTLYEPLYNALVYLVGILPGGEVALAVIVLTLVVKFILLPLSLKAVRTQSDLKQVKPEIDKIKEEHKDDRQAQAEAMMDLYSEYDIKPFSGFFLLFLQFPIIIALYYVFLRGGLPDIDPSLLYDFVPTPEQVDIMLYGINIAEQSLVLALTAGASQFLQTTISQKLSHTKESEEKIEEEAVEAETEAGASDPSALVDEMKQSFGKQLRYIFPPVVFFISYTLPAVVAIYWATSNIFQMLQEIYIKKVVRSKGE